MKTTTDTYNGTRFEWNETVCYQLRDGTRWNVPARQTSSTAMHLHPSRVTPRLLAKLNNGRVWNGRG